ncbi:MAG: phosphate transport system regulatory protein PhoU [Candidatus Edwardsbacteria bacterium RIFOXYD12_FULL_50_11]|uniref:Phosphate transport system regulatory protein PhoU n=1 Tax=Candidatus Edwardsbacteria bacterium GWF2_54_11 TaxID=1817851 RepID=A0A1F5RHV5_9BACT|nr:MAG: phosphate transport system regulatory protein PhoU [Candidatus Edwardsbacteria bacterium RifOxyC12_full_54_24]OGF07065.1 MAG: phosphate transport system regulatory protein PhoU [Candidatus Edwardsbacteria bacterium RifOxyA12_full_54_48]OGF10970.1 MAG: phosphate transport system regulatory protein PhoU [Candidatus Edwardsbacteria bacterium GWE2_54_12]OGF14127.1 MAG: phosphate transport system regulatory protein PhoU [Candidatus Edwardsbacteria bacterium GWF2_54_11]OGF15915.1 MAG: phospha
MEQTRHVDRELEHIKEKLLLMASKAEHIISQAVESLLHRDLVKAEQVMALDREIDRLEIEIENDAISLIACHQPAAKDLRLLIGIIKINNDIERIGDHGVNIAQCTLKLGQEPPLKPLVDIPRMAHLAASMLRDSLDSFVHEDAEKARQVCATDSQVDQLKDQTLRELMTYMFEKPKAISRALGLILISRNLERIADLSTNISEEVIYICQAKVIKHNQEKIKVLFICRHNAARSQMAEALLNHLAGDRFKADSAGLEPGELNPYAIRAMAEMGIDISAKNTQSVFDLYLKGQLYNYVITVCDIKEEDKCPIFPGIAQSLQWSFPDPASFAGSDQEKLKRTVEVRDSIKKAIEDFIKPINKPNHHDTGGVSE